MNAWVRKTFPVTLNGWDEGIDSFRFLNGTTQVESSIPWFVANFGKVTIPPTEANLKSVDADNSMGWHTHFEAWKAQEIIN